MSSKLSAQIRFLMSIHAIDPKAWDAIIPHGPKYSIAIREYMIAGVVRDIAKKITNHDIQSKLLSVGKEMVSYSSRGLVNGWEEGDDICPPIFKWPRPLPDPFPDLTGPQPDPWNSYVGSNGDFLDYSSHQKQLVASLKVLSTLTTQRKLGEHLAKLADELDADFKENALIKAYVM
ncbi:hypothetical protein [Flavobacterium sp. H122]|uniref:hypothetical protein n=1 Tax=Flavobacterium sp. H122 TaxID=2529860 RepID=UPI0010AA60B8|nr:hypothetical protein [Flavobacterium sp. H122]